MCVHNIYYNLGVCNSLYRQCHVLSNLETGVITVKGLAWGKTFIIIIEKDVREWGKVQGSVEHP